MHKRTEILGAGSLFAKLGPIRGCQPEKGVSPCDLATQRGCFFVICSKILFVLP